MSSGSGKNIWRPTHPITKSIINPTPNTFGDTMMNTPTIIKSGGKTIKKN